METRYQILTDLANLTRSRKEPKAHLIKNMETFPFEEDPLITRLFLDVWVDLAKMHFGHHRDSILTVTYSYRRNIFKNFRKR